MQIGEPGKVQENADRTEVLDSYFAGVGVIMTKASVADLLARVDWVPPPVSILPRPVCKYQRHDYPEASYEWLRIGSGTTLSGGTQEHRITGQPAAFRHARNEEHAPQTGPGENVRSASPFLEGRPLLLRPLLESN